jgi:hypothetical protein
LQEKTFYLPETESYRIQDHAYLLRPPIILGLCSPSRHHQRRLRPSAYGHPPTAIRLRLPKHKETGTNSITTTRKHNSHSPHKQPRFRRRTSPRPLRRQPAPLYSNNPNFHSPSLPSAASSPSPSPTPPPSLPPSSSPLSLPSPSLPSFPSSLPFLPYSLPV